MCCMFNQLISRLNMDKNPNHKSVMNVFDLSVRRSTNGRCAVRCVLAAESLTAASVPHAGEWLLLWSYFRVLTTDPLPYNHCGPT